MLFICTHTFPFFVEEEQVDLLGRPVIFSASLLYRKNGRIHVLHMWISIKYIQWYKSYRTICYKEGFPFNSFLPIDLECCQVMRAEGRREREKRNYLGVMSQRQYTKVFFSQWTLLKPYWYKIKTPYPRNLILKVLAYGLLLP